MMISTWLVHLRSSPSKISSPSPPCHHPSPVSLHRPDFTPSSSKSICDPTPRQALPRPPRKRRRNRPRKLRDITRIDLRRKAQIGLQDLRIQPEEVLRDAAEPRIPAVEAGDEDGGLAAVVELVVDAAHREHGALVPGQRVGDRGGEAVFEDEARFDVGALGDGEDLRGARVHVRGVHAAGLEEADGGGEVEADEGGEFLAGGEVALAAGAFVAAHGDVRVGGGVEVEFEVAGALAPEDGVAVHGCGGEFELVEQGLGDGGVGVGGGGGVLACRERDG